MHLELRTPEITCYDGVAPSVSLPGTEGRFQILDRHAPLLATLEPGLLRYEDNTGKEHRLHIGKGFAQMGKDNRLCILVESAKEA